MRMSLYTLATIFNPLRRRSCVAFLDISRDKVNVEDTIVKIYRTKSSHWTTKLEGLRLAKAFAYCQQHSKDISHLSELGCNFAGAKLIGI
jgi:hypothetical protein